MKNQRLLSLDVFRGITIAAMILVNNPGSWNHVYTPLLHAEWHGASPTDWIFPFFLFIVGISIAYAVGKRKQQGVNKVDLIKKIGKRSLIIFCIGMFINGFPSFHIDTIRIPGVLQRIAIVYGIAASLYVYLSPKQLLSVGIGCLLSYWAIMSWVPIPNGMAPNLDATTNLAAWLDHTLMDGHLWSQSKTWDPEGLLSTWPAIATGISGILIGDRLRQAHTNHQKVTEIMVSGTFLITIGLVWNIVFPINKSLWTSSYVCYTSGIAMLFLGCIFWITDIKQHQQWTKPFVVYGTNALFVYVLSMLTANLLYSISCLSDTGGPISIHDWLWTNIFSSLFINPKNSSFLFAITNVLFFLGFSWILYRKKIFIKV